MAVTGGSIKTRATSLRLVAALADLLWWALRGARHSEADLLAECGTLPRFIVGESHSEGRR